MRLRSQAGNGLTNTFSQARFHQCLNYDNLLRWLMPCKKKNRLSTHLPLIWQLLTCCWRYSAGLSRYKNIQTLLLPHLCRSVMRRTHRLAPTSVSHKFKWILTSHWRKGKTRGQQRHDIRYKAERYVSMRPPRKLKTMFHKTHVKEEDGGMNYCLGIHLLARLNCH